MAVLLRPPSRRRADGVWDGLSRRYECSLLDVGFGHRRAAPCEKPPQVLQQFLPHRHLLAEYLVDGLPREVVGSRPEPARGQCDVRALPRVIQGLEEPAGVVAHLGYPAQINAELGKLRRQVGGIRVNRLSHQQLSADGNYLCPHRCSPCLRDLRSSQYTRLRWAAQFPHPTLVSRLRFEKKDRVGFKFRLGPRL